MAIKRITRQLNTKAKSVGGPFTRRSILKGGLGVGAGLADWTFGIIGKAAAAPITMRFGSDSPIGAPHTKSALVMKELLESRTSGRIEVVIFPDSQLGPNGVMTNSVKAGTLDAVVTDASFLSTAVPEVDVFNLPFLYKDVEQVLDFANGPVGAVLKPKINEAFACEVLGFATDGSRNLWNSRRPVRTPADITGLKISVQPSKIQRDAILAFGGIPTVIEFNALYTSVQTGLIDGGSTSPAGLINLEALSGHELHDAHEPLLRLERADRVEEVHGQAQSAGPSRRADGRPTGRRCPGRGGAQKPEEQPRLLGG